MIERLKDLLRGPDALQPWTLPALPAPLAGLLPWRAWDEGSDLYINAASCGFLLELPPFVGIDEETLGALAGTLADAAPERAVVQIVHWTSPRYGAAIKSWAEPRRLTGGVQAGMAKRRGALFAHAGWRPLHAGGPPFTLNDCRVFLAACMAGPAGPAAETALGGFRRALEGALASAGAEARRVEPDVLLSLASELAAPDLAGEHDGGLDRPPRRWSPRDPIHLQCAAPGLARMARQRPDRRLPPGLFAAGRPGPDRPDHRGGGRSRRRARLPQVRPGHAAGGNGDRALSAGSSREGPGLALRHRAAQGRGAAGQGLLHDRGLRAPGRYRRGRAGGARHLSRPGLAPGRLGAERYAHLPAWLACLPMVPAGGLDADLARMGRMKTLLSSSAVNLAPVHGEWRGQGASPDAPPALLLIGRRGQPACWSPFANEAGNYNVAVTGKSGSGKSVLMQELVSGIAGSGGEAVVIDDGRSFQHTAEALGGAFIAFGKDPARLNPFAMIDADVAARDGDYREECFSMLAAVVGRMCRRRGRIDDIEAALIDEAIARAWEEAGNGADLGTVQRKLEEAGDRRASDMALALGPWRPGGALGRLFEGSETPALDAALTVFELAELKGRGDVQGVVLMLVVFLATQRMYHGPRTRPKAIVIDEAWDLLSGEDSRAFLEGAARRARKYRGALVTGTQSVNDYYANPAARAAWDNADWTIFLAQKDESVELLKQEKRIHCDPGMERALKSLATVDGRHAELVLHGPDGWRVARLALDPWSVALYSSRGPAFAAVERLKAEGLTTEQAIDRIAEGGRPEEAAGPGDDAP